MGTHENINTICTWVEDAWNGGRVDAHDDMYAPNYYPAFLQPPFPQNLDGLKAFIRHFRSAMPDFHLQIEVVVAEGDKVAWRIVATGTQHGELFGFPPTGKSARVDGLVLSRFENGKWAQDYASWDALGMLQQLSLIPEPSTP
jgi:steroid delta-isomerase-like uncharacterized protein